MVQNFLSIKEDRHHPFPLSAWALQPDVPVSSLAGEHGSQPVVLAGRGIVGGHQMPESQGSQDGCLVGWCVAIDLVDLVAGDSILWSVKPTTGFIFVSLHMRTSLDNGMANRSSCVLQLGKDQQLRHEKNLSRLREIICNLNKVTSVKQKYCLFVAGGSIKRIIEYYRRIAGNQPVLSHLWLSCLVVSHA